MDDGALKPIQTDGPPDDDGAFEALVAEQDALVLKPGERRRLEPRLERVAAKEATIANARAMLRLRDEDRAIFEKAVQYWGKALSLMRKPGEVDPLVKAVWDGGQRRKAERGTLRRFASQAVEPERVVDLRNDHLALAAAVSLFPTTVKDPWESPRLLVTGHNNPKLGGKVEKGEWKDKPIYHLTLEERASCPRSCALWAGCYGNAMHMARRHNHLHKDFLDLLRAEVWLLARAHRDTGFVVRLHTLGDFFSVEYVHFWAELIDRLPGLHVFGYTANHPDAEDAGERAIGQAIKTLTDAAWDQFAIRFSSTRGPQGTVVIDDASEAGEAIACPAQHMAAETDAKTEACSTCGLCWSPAARDKTIAFLRHGMKRRGTSTPTEEQEAA